MYYCFKLIKKINRPKNDIYSYKVLMIPNMNLGYCYLLMFEQYSYYFYYFARDEFLKY